MKLDKIEKAMAEFIEEWGEPDTIRLNPTDLDELKTGLNLKFSQVPTKIFGMQIVEDPQVPEGQCFIYNHKYKIEVEEK